ncbi:GNAT family N-acetyltransferase [Flavobacterium amniphilum]|uniref:GNAT family N-acetyltransferase n=1 Tax=Flavobacterium amniphilum TaxID=1834035 RepID=UPI00202A3B28|nr:GNAT family N-acetyltransferase [Flavobacterium amniphilum]MCL9804507.1 GNAT family N-acetyltransferase [Flavobacterium amniphilum]
MNFKLETERLILRPLEMGDAEGMFLLDSNPNVHTYLGNKPVKSIEESIGYIQNIQNQYKENGIGRFAVILKETGEFIGWSGIKFITEEENNHSHFYEIGYRFREEFWGKGFAYESAKAWYDYAFSGLNITVLYASAHIENAGSRKILEKIGLRLKNEYIWNNEIPCVWYASK